jgi:hypothetical protein
MDAVTGTIIVDSCAKMHLQSGKSYKFDRAFKIDALLVDDGASIKYINNLRGTIDYLECYDEDVFNGMLKSVSACKLSLNNIKIPESLFSIFVKYADNVLILEKLETLVLIPDGYKNEVIAELNKVLSVRPTTTNSQYESLMKFAERIDMLDYYKNMYSVTVDVDKAISIFKKCFPEEFEMISDMLEDKSKIADFIRISGIANHFCNKGVMLNAINFGSTMHTTVNEYKKYMNDFLSNIVNDKTMKIVNLAVKLLHNLCVKFNIRFSVEVDTANRFKQLCVFWILTDNFNEKYNGSCCRLKSLFSTSRIDDNCPSGVASLMALITALAEFDDYSAITAVFNYDVRSELGRIRSTAQDATNFGGVIRLTKFNHIFRKNYDAYIAYIKNEISKL